MDSVHKSHGVNENSKKRNLQYEGTSSAPRLNQEFICCPISINHNPASQSQSSEDKGKHVDSLDDHLRDSERGSLKQEPGRHVNFTASSSSMSNGITIRLNQDEGNHSMDNMSGSEENETMPIIESAQRSVKQKLDGCGRDAASTYAKGTTTQDSRTQHERKQCEVAGEKNYAMVEDASRKSESSDSRDISPPFGSHNSSCPESSRTNVPEGVQAEMESMNQAQINQDVLNNENSNNTQDSAHQEHASLTTPNDDFRSWMEGLMKIANTSQFQWPKWTVSYLLDSSDMDTLVTYYRILNLANDLNDEDLRLFLEEQLRKETAGLSEDVITRRLKTGIHGSSTTLTELEAMSENSDVCSICMAEFKDSDKIASLYYCPHVYHADCIKKWLLKSNACPLCRSLAIIPEQYPDWNGDIRLHRAFFMRCR